MKQSDIDLIANKEFKKSELEMINNSHTHIQMLIETNHQIDNLIGHNSDNEEPVYVH